MSQYPQRPGEPDCRDFLRTGRCKYGDSCKYHHPIGGVKATDPNEPPFPIRPDEPICQYYLKNGTCKFGQTCKFHHPPHMMGKTRSIYSAATTTGVATTMATPVVSGMPMALSLPNTNQGPPRDISIPGKLPLGMGLPQRPSEPDCIYFLKHGRCKYGVTCKYHHPIHHSHSNSNGTESPSSRYMSYPHSLYQLSSGRERSTSGGSMAETRESLGALPRNSSSSACKPMDSLTDSVPQRIQRQDHLDTISNSYQQYQQQNLGQSINPDWHRYYKQGTPDGSPKMGSPSFTSSTLASSYDTAVSNIEKLPQASFHGPNATLPRTLSGNSHHSRSSSVEDASLMFDDVMILPSHEASRVSNGRNYTYTGPHGNHVITTTRQRRDDPYEMNHSFSRPDRSRIPTGRYDERVIFHQDRHPDTTHEKAPLRNVDDGLSMMTSALLTMLDTPGNEKADAGTISTHSSNYEDAMTSMNDPPFVSKSLPNYTLSEQPGSSTSNSARAMVEGSMSRVIGPSSNGPHAISNSYNRPSNDFYGPPPSTQRNDSHSMFSSASATTTHNTTTHTSTSTTTRYNSLNHTTNTTPANHLYRHHSFEHLGMGNHGIIRPSYDSNDSHYTDPMADNQSRQHWNPDLDTVGSVPTQFFLSP